MLVQIVILEKWIVAQRVKEFRTLCGNRRFVIMFRKPSTEHCLQPDESSPYPYTLIL